MKPKRKKKKKLPQKVQPQEISSEKSISLLHESKSQLIKRCKKANLPCTGSKNDMLKRLTANSKQEKSTIVQYAEWLYDEFDSDDEHQSIVYPGLCCYLQFWLKYIFFIFKYVTEKQIICVLRVV